MKWTAALDAQLRSGFDEGLSEQAVAVRMGLGKPQVSGRARVLQLHYTGGGKEVRALDWYHPAVRDGRTIFRRSVVGAADVGTILKSGDNQRKLGKYVEKGPWRGMPIFSLTLEERATCPRSCALFEGCYGNSMPYAQRFAVSPLLERMVEAELSALNITHRRGFVVRIHVLGDLYSVPYTRLWQSWLRCFPCLHLFGYTARDPLSDIGVVVSEINAEFRGRASIRFSGTEIGPQRTIVVDNAEDALSRDIIVCPAQTGAARACNTCGLCWAPAAERKTIAFLRHGMTGRGRPRKHQR